ncbi:MAG: substrate-binding domain-containing protein [Azospirillaceae bacterium]
MIHRCIAPAAALVCATALMTVAGAASAQDVVGVSWRHFQEERWRIDEAGILAALEGTGWEYVSADAQSDPQKQLSDVETLIAQGADVLVILAQDSQAIRPAIERAQAEGIPVIAYDAPVDMADVLFVSFDNVAVGRLMAEAMVAAQPDGRWALIEGDSAHPIVDVFRSGQMQVLGPKIESGEIEVAAQQNTENWKPDVAQNTMDQILTANANDIDAVLAMNDGMAGGVASALAAQNMLGVALSGQDGDVAALNRIAKGHQTVTIWKNAYDLGEAAGEAAVALGGGATLEEVATSTFTTPSGIEQPAVLLEPVAITRDNLDVVVDADWIDREGLCQGVEADAPAACQ